jgi:hypothetical protein
MVPVLLGFGALLCKAAVQVSILQPAPENVYKQGNEIPCKINIDWGATGSEQSTKTVTMNVGGKNCVLATADGKLYTGFIDTRNIKTDSVAMDVVATESEHIADQTKVSAENATVTINFAMTNAVLSDSLLDDFVELD